MTRKHCRNVKGFEADILEMGGYQYTKKQPLSSKLACNRLIEATLEIVDLRGKKVLDIGCGDGTNTLEIFDRGKPASIHGFDTVEGAIKVAREKVEGRNITFSVLNVDNEFPYDSDSFDIALFVGLLHHVEKPIDALREALRVAPTVVATEPNGYNPIRKLLEKFSKYEIEHDEKSYTPRTLNRWVTSLGETVISSKYAVIIPLFCPDWFAKFLHFIESTVESIPLIRALACGNYIFVTQRGNRNKPCYENIN